jgi:hypothetical protein
MAEKVKQLLLSTTEDDSKRKLFEIVSIILMMKKVWAKMVVSVVLQLVGKEGLRIVLIVKLRLL